MISTAAREHLAVPTLPDLLVAAAETHPDRVALTIGDVRLTFAELLARATLAARGLVTLGVTRRSRVGLFMPNCPEFVELLFGISMLGATAVPINNRFRSRELLHVHSDARLAVIVTAGGRSEFADHEQRLRSLVDALPPDAPRPTIVALGKGHPSDPVVTGQQFAQLATSTSVADVERLRAAVRLRDLCAILYTSGTTAMPRGCLHTHEAMVRNGIVTGRSRFLLTSDDRFWDPLPMFHVSFLTPLIACIDAGAEMISMPRFEAEPALDLIEGRRATWVFAAFQAIAGELISAKTFAERTLPDVRMTMCVGHAPDLHRFQSAFPGASLLSTYGSTETAGVITYHEADATAEQRVTTCGTPFRGVELAVLDPASGRHLGPEQLGEILVRGYSVLDGYLNDPGTTEPAIDTDGWFHTGDLGLLTDDGALVFRGRLKDVIKVGGENVSAAEVEALLAEHPAVKVVNVVGAPDGRLDEVVAAFVEVADGATIEESELIDFCAGRVARFKTPRYVRFVDEWPMSATKVRKDELRARITAELLDPAAGAS